VTYTFAMSDATTPTPAPVTERTEAQIIHEMCVLSSKLTMLQFELKRLRNPTGKTMADLEGIWADAKVDAAEVDAARARSLASAEAGL